MPHPYFLVHPAPVPAGMQNVAWPCGRCERSFALCSSWRTTHGWGAVAVVGYVCSTCADQILACAAPIGAGAPPTPGRELVIDAPAT